MAEERAAAYRTWQQGAARQRSPFLGTAIIRTAPWACLIAFIVVSARMEPKWSNGWERRPAFDPVTVAVVLWLAALLACLAVGIGVRRWQRSGHSPDHNRKWSCLVFVVTGLASALAWWVWQLDSTLKNWGGIGRRIILGPDNYADRFPVLLMAPIGIIGLAGIIGMVTYLRPRPGPTAPENPYRSS